MPNNIFLLPTPLKKAKNMPNYGIDAKQHFFMLNHFKKVKFLKFGIKNANLATLINTP